MSDAAGSPMNRLLDLIDKQNQILDRQSKALDALSTQNWEQARMLEVLGRSVLRDVLDDVDRHIQNRQYTMLETMDLVAQGYSLARWGDGEVKLMLQPEFELMFQRSNSDLAEELQNMFIDYDSTSSYLKLAFPTIHTTRLWMGIWAENWSHLKPLVTSSTAYFANTHVSRPLFFQRYRDVAVESWRRVWEGKRVCIIAGKGSKFDLIPELFDNAGEIVRVDSLPRDAYDDYEPLKERIAGVSDADVYLLALGPTGTILAGYLASPEGGSKHAVDIGHLSSSYLNVFAGGADPERVPLVRS